MLKNPLRCSIYEKYRALVIKLEIKIICTKKMRPNFKIRSPSYIVTLYFATRKLEYAFEKIQNSSDPF